MMQALIIAGGLLLATVAVLTTLALRRARHGRAGIGHALPSMSGYSAPAGLERPMATLCVSNPGAACDLARDYAGKTFDAISAPHLPMPGCARENCQCRYERAINRRRGERRNHPERREQVRFESGDRRSMPDRRRSSGNRF